MSDIRALTFFSQKKMKLNDTVTTITYWKLYLCSCFFVFSWFAMCIVLYFSSYLFWFIHHGLLHFLVLRRRDCPVRVHPQILGTEWKRRREKITDTASSPQLEKGLTDSINMICVIYSVYVRKLEKLWFPSFLSPSKSLLGKPSLGTIPKGAFFLERVWQLSEKISRVRANLRQNNMLILHNNK